MNENPILTDTFREWLGAYADAELSPERAAWVEAHLGDCPECQQALDELYALSSLLHADDTVLDEALPLSIEPSAARRLLNDAPGRQPSRTTRALLYAFRYLPLAIFGGWAFLQAALLTTGALSLAQVLFPGTAVGLGWLFPQADGGGLLAALCNLLPGSLLCRALDALARLPLPGEVILMNLVLTALLAVLFASWLAGLWVQHKSGAETA